MGAGFLDTLIAPAVRCALFSTPTEVLLMTKSQLVSKLAESGGVSRKQIDDLLSNMIDTVVKTVKKGESVKIPGLGIFRLRKMKARMGRNPQTGEPIKIPARKKVGFSVAKTFKESVLGPSKK
jgi:DNA-binding protein HU-beta